MTSTGVKEKFFFLNEGNISKKVGEERMNNFQVAGDIQKKKVKKMKEIENKEKMKQDEID